MKPNNLTFYILSALIKSGNTPKYGQNLFIQNEPNLNISLTFQKNYKFY